MKKTAIAIALALSMIAVPAFAAMPSVGGSIQLQGDWQKLGDNPGRVIPGSVENQLNLDLGFNPAHKLGIEVHLNDGTNLLPGIKTEFQRAYYQNQGSLWQGGPQVTTTIGGLRFNYSPYVAWIGENEKVEGISVDGLQYGPVGGSAFYLFDGSKGLHAEANLADLSVGGTVVKAGEQRAIEVNGKMAPVAGAEITGTYATADDHSAIKLDGSMQVTPEIKVVGGYRSFDAAFAPALANPEVDRFNLEANPVAKYRDKEGFTVGAETQAYGAILSANIDRYHRKSDETQDENAVRFGVAKELRLFGQPLAASYELTLPSGQDAEHELTVGYQAPNGLQVQGKYFNNQDQSKTSEYLARVGMNIAF